MRFTVMALIVLSSPRTWAQDFWSEPYAGVSHLYRSTATDEMHLIVADLWSPWIRIRATRPGDRGMTVPQMAQLYGCEVAVNGAYYGGAAGPYQAWGFAKGFGETWTDPDYPGELGFVAAGRDNRFEVRFPPSAAWPDEEWMSEAVAGAPVVAQDGAGADPPADFCFRHDCAGQHPRTGVGLSQDGRYLYFVVIDGRSAIADGASTKDVGVFMAEFGAWSGLNLDGGGASTLYIASQGGVVNLPSDGTPRVVANHICVDIVDPFGTLKGTVRLGGEEASDPGVAGALVTLSTGATAMTGDDGYFEIAGVARGTVTVAAAHDSHGSGARDVYVTAAEDTWTAIAMFADPSDPGGGDPDAPSSPRPDGGDSEDGDLGSGCTAAGRSAVPWWAALALLLASRAAGARFSRTSRSMARGSGRAVNRCEPS